MINNIISNLELIKTPDEKTIFIDEDIFWYGSLNPLSHTGQTEESMLRAPSKQLSLLKARYEIYKRGFRDNNVKGYKTISSFFNYRNISLDLSVRF